MFSDPVGALRAQVGKPYIFDTPLDFAEANPSSFDCSGLVGWFYRHQFGVHLEHYTGLQWAELPKRPIVNVQPLDVLFYSHSTGRNSFHVAINLGGGELIEAPEPGIPVRVRAWHPSDPGMVQKVGYAKQNKSAAAFSGPNIKIPWLPPGTWPPPYDPGTLVGKNLTPTQRSRIIAWMLKVHKVLNYPLPTKQAMQKESSADLIDLYIHVRSAAILQRDSQQDPSNRLGHDIGKGWSGFTAMLPRIGEGIVGVGLLIVGAVAMSRKNIK